MAQIPTGPEHSDELQPDFDESSEEIKKSRFAAGPERRVTVNVCMSSALAY